MGLPGLPGLIIYQGRLFVLKGPQQMDKNSAARGVIISGLVTQIELGSVVAPAGGTRFLNVRRTLPAIILELQETFFVF